MPSAYPATCTRTRPLALGMLSATLLLAAACSGATPPPGGASPVPGAQRLVLKASDSMRFDPGQPTVDAGKPIQVVLQNDGQLVHDASFREGLGPAAAVVVLAAGGASTMGEAFTFPAPGAYRFVCSQPGHEAAGMSGTITVR